MDTSHSNGLHSSPDDDGSGSNPEYISSTDAIQHFLFFSFKHNPFCFSVCLFGPLYKYHNLEFFIRVVVRGKVGSGGKGVDVNM